MSIIFILQLVGGILAFVFQDELNVLLKNEMEDQMKLYDDPENGEMSKLTWDRMQIDVCNHKFGIAINRLVTLIKIKSSVSMLRSRNLFRLAGDCWN